MRGRNSWSRCAASARPRAPPASSRGFQVLRNRPDSRPTLKAIHVPALILVSGEDTLTPPNLAEGIAGAKLVILSEAGHLSNLERPEVFNDAVRGFVEQLKQ